MVSRLLLLKLLHFKDLKLKCTRKLSNQSKTCTEDTVEKKINEELEDRIFVDTNEQQESVSVDTYEQPEDNIFQDTAKVCRVCLKPGHIPIFGDEFYEDVSEYLISFSNVVISLDDAYPKYLCTACQSLVQGAILLRNTAQLADNTLKNPKTNVSLSVDEESHQDDNEKSYQDHNEETLLDFNDSEYSEVPSKTYHCVKCDLNFKSLKEIVGHRKTPEHKNRKYQCTICKKIYAKQYFRRHMQYHKLETPYICDVCGKTFIMQGHFSRHRMTHEYDLPFKCTLCPYKGRFNESLKMHMRSHTGEKPYQCTECPLRCINMSNLKRHMFTHRKDHDFKCDMCGRGFFIKRDLESHFKVDHTGIKDHVCNICGKAFGYRKQMMKHQLKVHKREKLQSGRRPLYLQIENKS